MTIAFHTLVVMLCILGVSSILGVVLGEIVRWNAKRKARRQRQAWLARSGSR